MRYDEGGRIYTVHICEDCGHRDLDHETRPHGKNTCSYGWCGCMVPKATVQDLNPAKECATIPGWMVA